MNIYFPDFMVSWLTNFIEFLMVYFIVSNIVDLKTRLAIKHLSIKITSLGVAHALIIAISWDLFGRSFVQTATYFSVSLMLVTLIVKHHRKHKTTFDDIIVINLIFYLIGNLFVGSSLFMINTLRYSEDVTHLLTLLLTLLSIMAVCSSIDFNKLFILIARKILIKLVLFTLALTFIIVFAFLQFDTRPLVEYVSLLLFLIVVFLIGLIQVYKIAYQYTEIMPEQVHDIKKLLTTLQIQAKRAASIEELKESISHVVALVGVKVDVTHAVVDDNFESFILTTIAHTKQAKKSTVTVIANIDYHENRQGISDIEVAYMLGVLLENAIETSTNKPIFINLFVSEYFLLMKVKNESKLKETDLYKMMKKGYSSKGSFGRGFGLSKLKKFVESKGGKLLPPVQSIHEAEKVNYLTMTILL